jgi:hypothetical protein
MRGGEKRGIRRDAARHCQTDVSSAVLNDLNDLPSVDNRGEKPVEKSVVRYSIESILPGSLAITACKRTLP